MSRERGREQGERGRQQGERRGVEREDGSRVRGGEQS